MAVADVWKYVGALRNNTCGNYCGIVDHKGNVFTVSNSILAQEQEGQVLMQEASDITARFSRTQNVIRKRDMGRWKDEQGQRMDFARTIGLASDGNRCYMLLHVGATYGSPKGYNYRPALAISQDCRTWNYRGPVKIDGAAQAIFSSSSAYTIVKKRHYMIQDAGAYGYGKLVVFVSDDGMNYTRLSGDINQFPDDSPVWTDMAECNGVIHATHEDRWMNDRIVNRHIASTDFINWTVKSADIGILDPKGVNIACIDNELWAVASGKIYKYIP